MSDSYKLDRKAKRKYRLSGSIAYDLRILSWQRNRQTVSIWTTRGRLKIPYWAGERQREMLKAQQGESHLVLDGGKFYLAATCNPEEPAEQDVADALGVDLGVSNLATDSDGKQYSGSAVKNVRHPHRRLRRRLQKIGTKSGKRRLRNLSGREKRFAKDVNHIISKKIVAEAQSTKRAIALEDLQHIRLPITVRREQRAAFDSRAFAQLRAFIEYKAKQAGVREVLVDPKNTSRACAECGHTAQSNRLSQSKFFCRACGYTEHADINAARNLRERGRAALVNQPNVANCARASHGSVATNGFSRW